VRQADVQKLIGSYLAQPIAALESDWTFAFGKPWFDVPPAIGFDKVFEIGGNSADRWDNQTPSRIVGVFVNRSSACRNIAMHHIGGAGPPKQGEVASLRKLLDSELESLIPFSLPSGRASGIPRPIQSRHSYMIWTMFDRGVETCRLVNQ